MLASASLLLEKTALSSSLGELKVGVISTFFSFFSCLSVVVLVDVAGASDTRPFVITVTQSAAAIVRRVGDFCFPCLKLSAQKQYVNPG